MSKTVMNELSALKITLQDEYKSQFLNLNYLGCFDAPPGLRIPVLISRCDANEADPLSCVIAENMKEAMRLINDKLPIGYGKVMRQGISITSNRAYIAVKAPHSKDYRVLRFDHNGSWVVNAFDSKDPVKLQKMWTKIDKGGEGAIVNLVRFRESNTFEGRELAKTEKVKRDAIKILSGEALPPTKQVPQRGNRKNGLSKRRQTAALNAAAIQA